jgi:hypothetical protein
MTFRRMTLGIIVKYVWLGDSPCCYVSYSQWQCVKCCYAECHYARIVVLSVDMLIVVMLNITLLVVVMRIVL